MPAANRPYEGKTATIIGGGVIGASWAALFLANGMKVIISDPDIAQKADNVIRQPCESYGRVFDLSETREPVCLFLKRPSWAVFFFFRICSVTPDVWDSTTPWK